MTVSVVIPAYKGQKFLSANLPAVLALKAREVIVVDDFSPDDTAGFVAKKFPKVRLVRHAFNTGFPTAVNDGFLTASGEIVVLLNQDVKPDKSLIKRILPHFSRPQVFAVTFNENKRSWAQAELNHGLLEFRNGPADSRSHRSFWASGGSAAFRRDTWTILGGFDPGFSPGYFEDLDLGWRAWRAGYEIFWEPKAKVSHAAPESTFKTSFDPARLQRIKDRNFLLAHWKNLDNSGLPAHLVSITRRLISHPGFILPALQALRQLPHISAFRSQTQSQLTNQQIFAELNEQ